MLANQELFHQNKNSRKERTVSKIRELTQKTRTITTKPKLYLIKNSNCLKKKNRAVLKNENCLKKTGTISSKPELFKNQELC